MTKNPINRAGVKEVTTKAKALEEARKVSDKISIIGGESIYREFMPLANRLLITEIEIVIREADTYFPSWCKEEWKEKSRVQSKESGISYSFVEYCRN